MKTALLYVLGGLMLALVVSVAWWTRLVVEPTPHQIAAGETVVGISRDRGVTMEAIAEANNLSVGQLEALDTGEIVAIPPRTPSGLDVWKVHGVGLGAEILGVLLSFWLALVAGLLPKGYRQQMFGISAALGLASYAGSHAVAAETPLLTPEFVFGSVKDGFAWAAAFPLFASVFGVSRLAQGGGAGVAPGGRGPLGGKRKDAAERKEPAVAPDPVGGDDEAQGPPAAR
jgi:hypothetical protein